MNLGELVTDSTWTRSTFGNGAGLVTVNREEEESVVYTDLQIT